MALKQEEIKKLMLSYGLATEKQINQAVIQAGEERVPLEKILVQKNYISARNFGQLIADYKGIPYVDLRKQPLVESVLKKIPESLFFIQMNVFQSSFMTTE